MADLVVIVPTRGRPQAGWELLEAFGETRTCAELVFAIDEDDPTKDEYPHRQGAAVIDTGGLPATMVRALNASAVRRATADSPPFAIGFMGDDHRPRTKGWDQAYLDALRELGTGIVYGNDLLQGANLPTQCAMTSDIVEVLGWMAPPRLTHMYVDNFWRDLGRASDCLRYLPDVIVEHMHPIARKAEWDEGYRRVNDSSVYEKDQQVYANMWASGEMSAAIDAVRALRSRVTA